MKVHNYNIKSEKSPEEQLEYETLVKRIKELEKEKERHLRTRRLAAEEIVKSEAENKELKKELKEKEVLIEELNNHKKIVSEVVKEYYEPEENTSN